MKAFLEKRERLYSMAAAALNIWEDLLDDGPAARLWLTRK